MQSQKAQDFCVADFATLSDERRSRPKIFLLFNMDKRTVRLKLSRACTFETSWDFANYNDKNTKGIAHRRLLLRENSREMSVSISGQGRVEGFQIKSPILETFSVIRESQIIFSICPQNAT